MCGLVGIAGEVGGKEEKIIKELLIVDSLRGVDSTGVAVVARGTDEVKIAKQLGHAYELIESNSLKKAFQGVHRAIIGHNRFGTVGKVSRMNAHPFDFETVVGVHNGTLTTKWKLHENNLFDTDSEALYNHMDQKGLKNLMENLAGAWALVWWDKLEQSINFLRNKERPLWLVFTEDGKQLYWCSELWMLEGVLNRNGVKMKDPFVLGEDVHLSVVVNKNGSMEKPRAVNMPSKYTPHVYQQQGKFTGSNVVTLPDPKKAGVTPVTVTSQSVEASTSGYGGSKKVKLKVLSLVENDGYGSAYLSCYDEKKPFAKVRWYFGRYVKPDDMIDEHIIADISEAIIRMNDPMYFKAIDNSVTIVDDVSDKEEEKPEEQVYEDHRGRPLSYNDWMHKHGDCNFCSQVILPTDRHAFNSAGQSFCEDCMDSQEVKQYTSFTKLVEKTI